MTTLKTGNVSEPAAGVQASIGRIKPKYWYPTSAADREACQELALMLSYCRPHGSKSEKKFINRFLRPLGVKRDGFGNLSVRIGDAPVLWSAHTDTVHRSGGRQVVDFNKGVLELPPKTTSSCLGADDTAGIWLMMAMIRAERPGLYIFHRGEEVGCLGSNWIATKDPDQLKGINLAVAFDRKGQSDIITHQHGSRCCSNAFADALSRELAPLVNMTADDSGIYTDTASYVDLVGECTNLSVGYSGAHSSNESLDVGHLFSLRAAILNLDVGKLPVERKPGEIDVNDYTSRCWEGWGAEGWGSYAGHTTTYYHDLTPKKEASAYGSMATKSSGWSKSSGRVWGNRKPNGAIYDSGGDRRHDDDSAGGNWSDVVRMVRNNPEAVADLLEQYGLGYREIYEEIMTAKGHINTSFY